MFFVRISRGKGSFMRSSTTKESETAIADDGVIPHNNCFSNGSGHNGATQDHLQQLAREVMSEIAEMDPSHSAELLGVFVSELFLLVAEQRQRETRRQKQAKGIAAAKAKGVRFGPKPGTMPDDFEELRQAWRDKKIPLSVAAELCGVPRSTFYDAALRAETRTGRAEEE